MATTGKLYLGNIQITGNAGGTCPEPICPTDAEFKSYSQSFNGFLTTGSTVFTEVWVNTTEIFAGFLTDGALVKSETWKSTIEYFEGFATTGALSKSEDFKSYS